MKFSLITATYNSAQSIGKTIASVNLQTHFDIEHIFIDGASSDNTVELINSLSRREYKIVSETDNGIYDALNKGIALATGDVIGFVHADDELYSENTIEDINLLFLKDNPDAIYGDGIYLGKNDRIVRNWISGKYDKKKIKYGWMPLHPTFFCKKFLYDRYGFFDANYRISADYDLILRFFGVKDVSINYLNQNLIKMAMGGASTNPSNFSKKFREDLAVMKKHNLNPFISLPFKILSKIKQFL